MCSFIGYKSKSIIVQFSGFKLVNEKYHRANLKWARRGNAVNRKKIPTYGIGNLKRQFAIENAIFNRFRPAFVDFHNSLRLPPIRCVYYAKKKKKKEKKKKRQFILYASDPSYQAFIVTLLHQDTSADHQRRISR